MRLGLHTILLMFYFTYWIVHDKLPFSIYWIVGLSILIFIFETIITSILKATSKSIKKSSDKIGDIVEGFDNRLTKLEDEFALLGADE